MKNKGTQFLAEAAVIGAIYVVLTLLFAPLSYGEIQIRFSEALTILPFFTPAAIPGLFVGCIIANLFGGAIPVDIIFGSIELIGENPIGGLVVIAHGTSDNINQAIQYLKDKNVGVEVILDGRIA